MVQELTMKFNAHCSVTNKPKKENLGMVQTLAIMFTVQNWSITDQCPFFNVHCSVAPVKSH